MSEDNCGNKECCGKHEDCSKKLAKLEKDLGLTPHVEIVCLGHTAPRVGKCYACLNDDQNKQCEHYKAHRIFTYQVRK